MPDHHDRRRTAFRAQASQWNSPIDRLNAATALDTPATFARPLALDTWLEAAPAFAADKLRHRRERDAEISQSNQKIMDGLHGVLASDDLTGRAVMVDGKVSLLAKARRELEEWTHPVANMRAGRNGVLADDHPKIVKLRRDIATLEKEIAADNRLVAKRGNQRLPEDLLKAIPRAFPKPNEIAPYEGEVVRSKGKATLRENGKVIIEVDESQARPELLKRILEIDTIKDADLHPEEKKVLVEAEVNALAEKGQPKLPTKAGGRIKWPARNKSLDVHGIAAGAEATRLVASATDTSVDTHSLLAFLFADDIIARLHEEIDEAAAGKRFLTAEERQEQIAELEDQILALERIDVAIVEASNGEIPYRPNTDPKAFLGAA